MVEQVGVEDLDCSCVVAILNVFPIPSINEMHIECVLRVPGDIAVKGVLLPEHCLDLGLHRISFLLRC